MIPSDNRQWCLLFGLQKELQYSMKRKTVNQIDSVPVVRPLKKNKSCQLHQRYFSRTSKLGFRNQHQFVHAAAIAELLIEELLQNLDGHFREADQRSFLGKLAEIVGETTAQLGNMLNPLSTDQQNARNDIRCEPEPQMSTCDLMCGSNSQPCEKKVSKMPRISIALREQHKRERSQLDSKQVVSSKNLIKLAKQQIQQRKQGVVALKESSPQQKDSLQEILRDKLLKDKKNVYYSQNSNEVTPKPNILPSIEEYSFDYDGSLFPIKKNIIQNSLRIKVLNTTCKLTAKQGMVSKFQGAHLKTEMEQTEKKRNLEEQKRALSLKRQSNNSSMQDLLTSQGQERLRSKIEESIRGQAVRLRQLKP